MAVIIALIAISILIFVHELGHFTMAKRAGMKVEEFGFGFPPRLWGMKHGETTYSINAIPFGGFVRILGEDGGHRSDPRSFSARPLWQRLSVIAAGVAMNFLFAAVLLTGSNAFGLRVGLTPADLAGAHDLRVQVLDVSPDSPAATSGLEPLDELVRLASPDGTTVTVDSPETVQDFAGAHAGEELTVTVRRGGGEVDLAVPTRAEPPAGQGPIGISMALTGVVSYPWYDALWRGVYDALLMTWNTVLGYWHIITSLVTSGSVGANVSGPVGIVRLTGQAASVGFSYLVQFVAIISVNLAVLNALPFPALDGGRAVLLGFERLRGKPLARRWETGINLVGFLILLGLMVAITVRDVVHFF